MVCGHDFMLLYPALRGSNGEQDGSSYLGRRIIMLSWAIAAPYRNSEHKTLILFLKSIKFADPNTPPVFNCISPYPTPHLEYKCRSLSKAYLEGLCQVSSLFVHCAFQLATQVVLWVLSSCQAAEGGCQGTWSTSWSPTGLLAQIPCLHHPYYLRITGCILQIILVHNGISAAIQFPPNGQTCVFLSTCRTDLLSQLAFLWYSPGVFEVSAVITSNERKERSCSPEANNIIYSENVLLPSCWWKRTAAVNKIWCTATLIVQGWQQCWNSSSCLCLLDLETENITHKGMSQVLTGRWKGMWLRT